jgi:hypothetical protein
MLKKTKQKHVGLAYQPNEFEQNYGGLCPAVNTE